MWCIFWVLGFETPRVGESKTLTRGICSKILKLGGVYPYPPERGIRKP